MRLTWTWLWIAACRSLLWTRTWPGRARKRERGWCRCDRLHLGARDPVVPAQSVLVKKAPEIAESGRKRGEKRRQHAPAAPAAVERGAVKSCQSQPGGAKSGSRAGVHHKQEFVSRPKQDCDHAERTGESWSGEQWERSANGVQAGVQMKKNCGKGRQSRCQDNAIHEGSKRAPDNGS